jgi:hypothetical protein
MYGRIEKLVMNRREGGQGHGGKGSVTAVEISVLEPRGEKGSCEKELVS